MSEGTSPSSTSDEGSRSTPSNLPKAATRQRKKRTSDSEDEDYRAEEDEATSKKVVQKKVLSSTAVKPGMKIKRPAGRQPMSKAKASTQLPEMPEHPLKRLWDLHPKNKLWQKRKGRKGLRRPLPECLADNQL